MRLLRLIYRTHHVYLIHVDARQDFLFRSLLPLEAKFDNIRLVRERKSSIWGGASLLLVLLDTIKDLLQMDDGWQFVFNLSESDFPLRTVEELETLLAANPGRNFIASSGGNVGLLIKNQGTDRVFHEVSCPKERLAITIFLNR